MALSNVQIIKSDGNVLALPLSDDGVSGLIVFHANGGLTPEIKLLLQPSDIINVDGTSDLLEYHVNEYFSKSNYPLYVLISSEEPTAEYAFDEIEMIQNFAEGKIRQIGVLNATNSVFATTQISKLNLAANKLEDNFTPVQIIYACINETAIASLPDLKTLNSPRVSYIYGEDKLVGGIVEDIYVGEGVVSSIGLILGLVSSAPVHESIAWVGKYDVSASISEPGFQDGTLVKAKTYSTLNALDNKQYLFFRKFTSLSGTYVNFDYVCADPTQTDFSSISLNRVYDKAFRNLRSAYLPSVNSPVYVDKSGKLSAGAVAFFENLGSSTLEVMKANGEISDFSVAVDPNQKVLVNKTLNVVAKIIPVGVAKTISIKLGFTLAI